MRTTILVVLAGLTLILALAFAAPSPAVPNASAGVVSAAPLPAATATPAPAEHPEIRDALAALRNARSHLEHAAHDFGGHRVEAIKATDEAIRQLEICLKYDK
jgi:hypothetical protein